MGGGGGSNLTGKWMGVILGIDFGGRGWGRGGVVWRRIMGGWGAGGRRGLHIV